MNSSACVRRLFARALSFACVAWLAGATTAAAQTLMWDANPEPDLAGYIVQYGMQSGNPSTTVDVGNVTSRQFTGLTPGTTYYFRVVAYNTSSQQSAPSSQVSFTVPVASGPTVTGLAPTSGPATGGTVITITGTSFAAGATVRVGGASATSVSVLSATQIRATTPAGTAGARDVQVTNPDGQSATRTGGFTYNAAAPTLTSISPTSGSTAGGTTITLTGTGFVSGGTVRVGGTAATNVSFVSATQLTARTPAGTAGARDVVVTNPDGQSATRTGGFTYTAPGPLLTAVSPASGPASGGTTITVTGGNFVSGATVRVGGTAATNVSFVSATQLTARTPAGTAGARDVVVTNPDGQSATLTGGFTYTGTAATPTLTAVSPASGTTTGGTAITLTGTNFVSGATVRVGGTAATNVTFVSATQLTALTPWGTLGARDVVVTNPNGQSATQTGAFTYTSSNTPTITSVTPASGPIAGGTLITVRGTSFTSRDMTLRIGGVPAKNVVATNPTTLTAVTPAGSAGARDMVLTNGWGLSVTLAGGFTYTSSTTSSQTGTFTRYLAEGVQTNQMNTQLAIANAEPADARATLTFMDATGRETAMTVDVPARARQTVDLSTVPQLAGQTFSTRIDANQPVAVDRLVTLDAEGASASLEAAVDRPSPTWFFAEGSTADPMELFYLVQNPGTTPARVQVRYLLPAGAPVTRVHEVAAGSRATIWVDREDAALASTDVAAEITSLDGTPIVVERSLYVKQNGSAQPRGGDTSTGVTAPATSWFVEAATGPFAARLLLANPGAAAADVRATYQLEDGRSVVRGYTVAPGSRRTVDVAAEDPSLADAQLGVKVEASAPIVVERSKWWGTGGQPDEAVSGTATATGGRRWLLAEAEQGGARQAATDVVVFNRGAATTVTVTLLFEAGPEVSKTFPVPAGARFAVPMTEAFPDAAGRRFSVLVEGADPSANLIVDRAIFWQATDGSRTAGADGAAVRLR